MHFGRKLHLLLNSRPGAPSSHFEPHLGQAELALDHAKRMLHLGPDAGLAVFFLLDPVFALPSGTRTASGRAHSAVADYVKALIRGGCDEMTRNLVEILITRFKGVPS